MSLTLVSIRSYRECIDFEFAHRNRSFILKNGGFPSLVPSLFSNVIASSHRPNLFATIGHERNIILLNIPDNVAV